MTSCNWCQAKRDIHYAMEENGISDRATDDVLDYYECVGNRCENEGCDSDECYVEDICPSCVTREGIKILLERMKPKRKKTGGKPKKKQSAE